MQYLLFDSHNLDHMVQFVHCLSDVVLNLYITIDDVVLKLQVFESLHQFLDFATNFSRVLVFEFCNRIRDSFEVIS
jgi:hypothetical protein